MAYRQIDLRIHGDEKFRRLSTPPPNGRDLFLYLLIAKEGLNIPGVIPAGAALAETLRWSYDGLRQAFAELEREGLAVADWDAPLVFVPNAIRHNLPVSPNHVTHWANAWGFVPESPLKRRIWETLRGAIEPLGKGFQEAFRKGFPEPFGSPSVSPPPSHLEATIHDPRSTKQKDLAGAEAPRLLDVPVSVPPPPRAAGKPTAHDSDQVKKPRKLTPTQTAVEQAQKNRLGKTSLPDRMTEGHWTLATKLMKRWGLETFLEAHALYLADPRHGAAHPPWAMSLFLACFPSYLSRVQTAKAGAGAMRKVRAGEDLYRTQAG